MHASRRILSPQAPPANADLANLWARCIVCRMDGGAPFPCGRDGVSRIPLPLLTDSYKASHAALFPPDAVKAVAVRNAARLRQQGCADDVSPRREHAMQYGEFRRGFRLDAGGHDVADTRLVFYGMRYIVESYLMRRWTRDDVETASRFYRRARVRRCAANVGPLRTARAFACLPARLALGAQPLMRRAACRHAYLTARTTLAARRSPSRVSSLSASWTRMTVCARALLQSRSFPASPADDHACAGYFPVRLEALPEGSVVHAHCPVYQARAGCLLCSVA